MKGTLAQSRQRLKPSHAGAAALVVMPFTNKSFLLSIKNKKNPWKYILLLGEGNARSSRTPRVTVAVGLACAFPGLLWVHGHTGPPRHHAPARSVPCFAGPRVTAETAPRLAFSAPPRQASPASASFPRRRGSATSALRSRSAEGQGRGPAPATVAGGARR